MSVVLGWAMIVRMLAWSVKQRCWGAGMLGTGAHEKSPYLPRDSKKNALKINRKVKKNKLSKAKWTVDFQKPNRPI